jgi:hypothetical protein
VVASRGRTCSRIGSAGARVLAWVRPGSGTKRAAGMTEAACCDSSKRGWSRSPAIQSAGTGHAASSASGIPGVSSVAVNSAAIASGSAARKAVRVPRSRRPLTSGPRPCASQKPSMPCSRRVSTVPGKNTVSTEPCCAEAEPPSETRWVTRSGRRTAAVAAMRAPSE